MCRNFYENDTRKRTVKMIKYNHKTSVIFRKYKNDEQDIIALMPYESWKITRGCMSYMHIGQHSESDYDFVISITNPATPDEYKSLKNELESLGYNLKIIKRAQRNKMYKL